ncbi:MAG: glycine hydroxymethyltransferase [Simkaniaceae bacterium]|nr:glycine hydroxymethyltransferase [Candidatus Sacchlamyda saccharinae]
MKFPSVYAQVYLYGGIFSRVFERKGLRNLAKVGEIRGKSATWRWIFATLTMNYLENYFQKFPKEKRSKAAIAYLAALDHIGEDHPEVAATIVKEIKDQRKYLKLIASENYSSLAVQLAMGNLLTDKYAEGFSHHRFYAGCENIDTVEDLAASELKKIFRCDHAYVQPHCGADANMVAIWAFLTTRFENKEVERLGKKSVDQLTAEEYEAVRKVLVSQKMMGMGLGSGGHLTHGYRRNISSKIMQSVSYDVDPKTGLLDYDALSEQVKREKPALLIVGYSAYPRLLDFAKLREIADSVGAGLMADMAHFSGLVAGKVLQGNYDPVPFADLVTSTTHKTLRGPRGGLVMCTNEFKEAVDRGCPLVLGGPLPHVIAAKAVAFQEVNTPEFQKYAHQIVANANSLANSLIANGAHILTNGTDNHLIVIDVSGFGLTGMQAEKALRQAGLTVNRNSIPNDPNGAWFTSGVRIGTPAITSRGMREKEMESIGKFIVSTLQGSKPAYSEKLKGPGRVNVEVDPKILERVRSEVNELLEGFPLYPELVVE